VSAVIDVLPVVTTLCVASDINEAHRLARQSADSAVQHAIRCGELLIEQKARLKHGEFGEWIAAHCKFSQATANNYMKAAQNPTALGNSLRSLFPSGRTPPTSPSPTRRKPNIDDEAVSALKRAVSINRTRAERARVVAYILKRADISEYITAPVADNVPVATPLPSGDNGRRLAAAVGVIEPMPEYKYEVSRLKHSLAERNRLRRKLRRAEEELAISERNVIRAAEIELEKGKSA
jgi:hypothetical protein